MNETIFPAGSATSTSSNPSVATNQTTSFAQALGPSADPATVSAADPGDALSLSWVDPPGMIGLSIKNFLYKVITLGIYNFWGKTEVRKRIWGAMRINGEPLQYTGTGKEMFLGFLFILAVLTIPTMLVGFLAAIVLGPQGAQVLNPLISIAFFYLIGVGMHRAIRYRLSRTLWRGIRGGLEGSAWRYGWTYFWTGIVLVLTLGWASPWRATKLQGLIVNDMRFGNRPFQFSARSGPLYGPFLALWLSGLAIALAVGLTLYMLMPYLQPYFLRIVRPGRPPDPTALFVVLLAVYGVFIFGLLLYGVISAWYRAQIMNHFAAHTTFEGARFSAHATGRSLIWLGITNLLLVVFTLGLLAPVAQTRSARYFIERLRLSGNANLDQILQGAAASGRGEGLAQAFDIDAF